MSHFLRMFAAVSLAGLALMTGACSKGSSGSGSSPAPTPQVQGVAIPKSVSVVTATNAQ